MLQLLVIILALLLPIGCANHPKQETDQQSTTNSKPSPPPQFRVTTAFSLDPALQDTCMKTVILSDSSEAPYVCHDLKVIVADPNIVKSWDENMEGLFVNFDPTSTQSEPLFTYLQTHYGDAPFILLRGDSSGERFLCGLAHEYGHYLDDMHHDHIPEEWLPEETPVMNADLLRASIYSEFNHNTPIARLARSPERLYQSYKKFDAYLASPDEEFAFFYMLLVYRIKHENASLSDFLTLFISDPFHQRELNEIKKAFPQADISKVLPYLNFYYFQKLWSRTEIKPAGIESTSF